jgi:ribosomal protein L37AE/L43A
MKVAVPTSPTPPPAPPACPFCRSTRVTTTSKLVTDSTYWRCEACGQIWNPARLVAPRAARRW